MTENTRINIQQKLENTEFLKSNTIAFRAESVCHQSMQTDLPEDKGTYILLASLAQMKRLEIGRLGEFDLVPGCYAYVGSAHGPGGLRARVEHHLEATANPHWHIDYLLRWAIPVELWFAVADRKLEHDWAEFLGKSTVFRTPIPRFGSSDYRRSRTTHLFYAKHKPSFAWFNEQMRDFLDPTIRVHQALFPNQVTGRAGF